MKVMLSSVLILSLLLISCPHEKMGKIEDELLDLESFAYEEQLRAEDYGLIREEVEDTLSRLPIATIGPSGSCPSVYFYRLLTPLSELGEANWSDLSSKYVFLPDKYSDWVVIFIEDGYYPPAGTRKVEFSETISYKEFTKLNPNPEGWRFVRLHEGKLDLEKWTDEGSTNKSLTWNQLERQFPGAIILLSWSFDVSEQNKVFVTGVDLSGKHASSITADVSLTEVDTSRVLAVANCENRKIVVRIDGNEIRTQIDRMINVAETQ